MARMEAAWLARQFRLRAIGGEQSGVVRVLLGFLHDSKAHPKLAQSSSWR